MTRAEQIAHDVIHGNIDSQLATIYSTNGVNALFMGGNLVMNYYEQTDTFKVLKTDSSTINETVECIVKYM